MKLFATRLLVSLVLGVLAWALLTSATASKGSIKAPDKLVILSTTDVKGEYKPCG